MTLSRYLPVHLALLGAVLLFLNVQEGLEKLECDVTKQQMHRSLSESLHSWIALAPELVLTIEPRPTAFDKKRPFV
jgi:hypothetical protein